MGKWAATRTWGVWVYTKVGCAMSSKMQKTIKPKEKKSRAKKKKKDRGSTGAKSYSRLVGGYLGTGQVFLVSNVRTSSNFFFFFNTCGCFFNLSQASSGSGWNHQQGCTGTSRDNEGVAGSRAGLCILHVVSTPWTIQGLEAQITPATTLAKPGTQLRNL